MTYQEIIKFIESIKAGEVSAAQLIAKFQEVRANKQKVLDDIDKSYTLAQLKKKFYRTYDKKKDYVEKLYDDALGSFNVQLNSTVSYQPFSGQTYEGQLALLVEKTTDEDVAKYVAYVQEQRQKKRKVYENPETIEEYREFVYWYGADKLTKEQRGKYEELLAEAELKRQAAEAARKGTVKRVEIGDTSMDIQQTKHTKTGADLWVVRLSDRVEKDVYQELNTAAKRLGGYYSSYRGGGAIPGFQFKTEDAAKQFVAVRDGDVQKQKDDKIESAAERLKAAAERKAEAAQEELNKDRKTNTARRARQANSIEESAMAELKWAAVLDNLAEALKAGKLKYLAKVNAVSQLETLDMIWGRAKARRFHADTDLQKNSGKYPRDIEKDLDYVEYPHPQYWPENLLDRLKKVADKPGVKMAAARIGKAAIKARDGRNMMTFKGSSIDDLKKLASASTDKYIRDYIADPIAHYERMQRMGITTLPVLKMALKEYASLKESAKELNQNEEAELEMKRQEREFVGRKYDGFFPTPEPLVDELLRLADIQPGDEVLEPSAGIGHIADAIKRAHPGAKLQVVELVADMARLLEKKGHTVDQGDFLSYRPEKRFDVVVMNPPFEKDADIEHVMHAWELLKPGGRLVAIMAGNKDGQGKKKEAFREMVDEYGTIERNPEGAFKSAFRSTGVNTVTVVLDKPSAAPVDKEEEKEPMIQKTDCPKEMNIGDIYIDERRFQNRSKLNEHVVNSIAENYDENQFDPVVVWDDPEDGKTYLLAGHHRLAGVKKAGRKTIKTRCFEGSEAEAIAYAKELSNANRTLETPLERAAIYRRKLDAGESPDTVRKQAEKLEGKNARYILNLAYLNPDGKVVNALLALADNSDKLTQNNLEKIADWAGEARRQFGVLTNQHENECYDFLMENFGAKRPAISRKDEFLGKISAIVNAMDFDKEKALNLKRIQYKTQGESEYERQMGEIDDRIREVETKKDALKDRLNNPRNPKYVNPQAPDYDEVVRLANAQMDKYDEELKALRKQKLELAQKKGQMVSGGLSQGDLFAQAAAKIEQVVEEVRQQQKKPAAPAQPKPVAADPAPSKPEETQEKEEPILTGVENLRDQYERAYDPAYRKYISGRLKELSELGAEMSADKVIELGILVRPYVQRFRGAVVDVESTNKRVLAPTLNNLARWAEMPGKYDLVGVDIAQGADPTTLAKQVKRSALFNLLGIK